MRKAIKHPLTEFAEELAMKKLEIFEAEGYDPVDILHSAILGSWRGLFVNAQTKRLVATKPAQISPKDSSCCICKRPLNGSFIYWRGEKKCHSCD